MKAHFTMFAAYNGWANQRLYAACADLPDAMRKAPAGAFFGSLHNTLNHLLVTDRIWMYRFTGTGPMPAQLAAIACDRFEDLAAERTAPDALIESHVAGLSEADLAQDISYTPITVPTPVTQPLGQALAHLFNHQTHHRGQCHHMLTAAGRDAPPLDLLYFQRER